MRCSTSQDEIGLSFTTATPRWTLSIAAAEDETVTVVARHAIASAAALPRAEKIRRWRTVIAKTGAVVECAMLEFGRRACPANTSFRHPSERAQNSDFAYPINVPEPVLLLIDGCSSRTSKGLIRSSQTLRSQRSRVGRRVNVESVARLQLAAGSASQSRPFEPSSPSAFSRTLNTIADEGSTSRSRMKRRRYETSNTLHSSS